MMNLFKRRKAGFPRREKAGAADSANETFCAQKQKLSDWLQGRSERLSLRRKRTFLFIALLISVTYFIGLVTGTVPGKSLPDMGSVKKLALPGQANTSVNLPEWERIEQFRRYMDSLNRTPEGRTKISEIMKAHPGILDSIAKLERIIIKNKK